MKEQKMMSLGLENFWEVVCYDSSGAEKWREKNKGEGEHIQGHAISHTQTITPSCAGFSRRSHEHSDLIDVVAQVLRQPEVEHHGDGDRDIASELENLSITRRQSTRLIF